MKPSLIRRLVLISFSLLVVLSALIQIAYLRPGTPVLPSFIKGLQFWVIDASGAVINSNVSQPLPPEYNNTALPSPETPLSLHKLSSLSDFVAIGLLNDVPRRYVVYRRKESFFADLGYLQLYYYLPGFSAYFLALFLGATLFLRRQRGKAKMIIDAMLRGDLRVRFKVSRPDETGRLMLAFNNMAKKLEDVVGKLRETEGATSALLEDLSRDIREPLTALRSLLNESRESQSKDRIQELMNIASAKMKYFERLIENLFLLEQVKDPTFRAQGKPILLSEMIQEQVNVVSNSIELLHIARKVQFRLNMPTEPVILNGEPFAFRHLFRNLLENAAGWARTEVTVSVLRQGDHLRIAVADDGPGFPGSVLANVGKSGKLVSAVSDNIQAKTGMGALVIRTITEAYGGEVHLKNGAGSPPQGAEVTLLFPESLLILTPPTLPDIAKRSGEEAA